MMASKEGHVDTCAVLIERGATVDYQNKVRLMYYRILCSVYCEYIYIIISYCYSP